jgi:hypothetical protein
MNPKFSFRSQALRSLRLRRALGSAAARFFRSHSLQRYVQKWRTFTARSQVDDECTAIVQHKVGKRVLRRAFQVWKSMFKMQLRLKCESSHLRDCMFDML